MMLVDDRGGVAISSLGWVDRGSLWVFRAVRGVPECIPFGDARYLSLHAGSLDHFSVVHHFDDGRIVVSVHRFSEPAEALSRVTIDRSRSAIEGDPTAWTRVPTSYVSHYSGPDWSDFALIRIHPLEARVELQPFDWYSDDYDKAYQGIVGVTEVPGEHLLVVSVQRSSRLILYDPIRRSAVGQIDLCGRGGNPSLFFRRRANELWADDYDTIVKIEPGTWTVRKSRILQPGVAGARSFIGSFCFDRDESICLVARPFSGDVLALSPQSLRPRFRCRLGSQPLEAILLSDRSLVARDWKSGALLRGELRRTWRW